MDYIIDYELNLQVCGYKVFISNQISGTYHSSHASSV